jgi:hypothetical protein
MRLQGSPAEAWARALAALAQMLRPLVHRDGRDDIATADGLLTVQPATNRQSSPHEHGCAPAWEHSRVHRSAALRRSSNTGCRRARST